MDEEHEEYTRIVDSIISLDLCKELALQHDELIDIARGIIRYRSVWSGREPWCIFATNMHGSLSCRYPTIVNKAFNNTINTLNISAGVNPSYGCHATGAHDTKCDEVYAIIPLITHEDEMMGVRFKITKRQLEKFNKTTTGRQIITKMLSIIRQ